MDLRSELKELPAQNAGSGLVLRCLASLGDGTLQYDETGPIPVREARAIYRVRARLNERRGGPIRGYEGLLAGLASLPDPAASVRIHGLSPSGGTCLVFTDAPVKTLIGVLIIPAKTEPQPTDTRAVMAA